VVATLSSGGIRWLAYLREVVVEVATSICCRGSKWNVVMGGGEYGGGVVTSDERPSFLLYCPSSFSHSLSFNFFFSLHFASLLLIWLVWFLSCWFWLIYYLISYLFASGYVEILPNCCPSYSIDTNSCKLLGNSDSCLELYRLVAWKCFCLERLGHFVKGQNQKQN